jgi:hypothetical protein
MKYTVFFSIFGKKMKTTVDAVSEADAKRKVTEKLIFHAVEKQAEPEFDIVKGLKDLLGVDIKSRLHENR